MSYKSNKFLNKNGLNNKILKSSERYGRELYKRYKVFRKNRSSVNRQIFLNSLQNVKRVLDNHFNLKLHYGFLVSKLKRKDIYFSLNAADFPIKSSNSNEDLTGLLKFRSYTFFKESCKIHINDKENSNSTKYNDNLLCKHYNFEIVPELKEKLLNKMIDIERSTLIWPTLGKLRLSSLNLHKKINFSQTTYSETSNPSRNIQNLINTNIFELPLRRTVNGQFLFKNERDKVVTQLQSELFCVLKNYHDMFYPFQSPENTEEIRAIYCFHVVNHVLNTWININKNNRKIKEISCKEKHGGILNVGANIEYRDRGLVRPKILILLPFRRCAAEVINAITNVLYLDNSDSSKLNGSIINYHRFLKEFCGDNISHSKWTYDQKNLNYPHFCFGNVCDNFKIGICITNNILKLYTDFYSSDIIIASPLGIRRVIGAFDENERNFDFLSSIEILILDQADILLAQNWENVLHIIDHMNLKPSYQRNLDFSRVYSSSLNELSRFYRQTLLFSNLELPELRSFFENKCCNYSGKVHVSNPILIGSIQNIILNTQQTFYKIVVSSFKSTFELRFIFFIKKILPKVRKLYTSHCLIYIPSYFDFVRLRNYFKKELISFVQICEYAKNPNISRARDIFYHSKSQFILYSERSHLFQRKQIKGARHIIFYQPPSWPSFYSEMINLMHECKQNTNESFRSFKTVSVLYTKYDLLQMNGILGNEIAKKLVKSGNLINIFST